MGSRVGVPDEEGRSLPMNHPERDYGGSGCGTWLWRRGRSIPPGSVRGGTRFQPSNFPRAYRKRTLLTNLAPEPSITARR